MKKVMKEIQVKHARLTSDILDVEVMNTSKTGSAQKLKAQIEHEESKIREILQVDGISKKNANVLDSFLSDYGNKKIWLNYLQGQTTES